MSLQRISNESTAREYLGTTGAVWLFGEVFVDAVVAPGAPAPGA